jgi:hypothetical protein
MSVEKQYDYSVVNVRGATTTLGLPLFYYYGSQERNWIELGSEISGTSFTIENKINGGITSTETKFRSQGIKIGVKFSDYFIFKAGRYDNTAELPYQSQTNYRFSLGGIWEF